jgi:hypothetical protein
MPKRTASSGIEAATPKNAALAGIALASVSWFVLLFAGFGGKKAACPEVDAAWVVPLVVACAVTATLGMAAAVWAYRESAGAPSSDWLLGAAGLYVTTLAWTATIAGAVSLFLVDMCSL